uniref:Uncharacterized protein n=1 Tax=Gadus morhua TaxID=8049 RepID=A0A8C5FW09_GADMO
MSESHLMGFLKIPFGQSVPQHSLVLLHWFANTIEFDNNDLIELTFEPSNGDYGTHHYGNYEGVLDPLTPGQQYYTLGNINPMINNNGISLPSYVAGHVNHLLGGEELNRARIIFSLLDQDTICQVFITQHYEANQGLGTGYDPVHTYQITFNLLRVLRVFSLDRRQHSDITKYKPLEVMTVEVRAGPLGKAKVHWSGVPRHTLHGDVGALQEPPGHQWDPSLKYWAILGNL